MTNTALLYVIGDALKASVMNRDNIVPVSMSVHCNYSIELLDNDTIEVSFSDNSSFIVTVTQV